VAYPQEEVFLKLKSSSTFGMPILYSRKNVCFNLSVKKYLRAVILVVVGYILGSALPIFSLLSYKNKVRFTADYLIKAGTIGEKRHSRILGDIIYPIEIQFAGVHPYPALEKIP